MENSMWDDELSKDVVAVAGVDNEKKTNMVKGIVIGASVVGVGWLATYLYKKFKKRTSKKTVSEVIEVFEEEV